MYLTLKKHSRWLIPLFLFLAYAPWSEDIDLAIAKKFYTPGEVGDNRFVQSPFVQFIFDWGAMPAWITLMVCFAFLGYSFLTKRDIEWRKAAVVPILVMAIGSGVFVHLILKDHWGRPRPRQVIEFGGEQTFRPYYKPYFNNPTTSKSFTCGHCSVGFFFFCVALIGQRMKQRWLEILGYVLAIIMGTLLSYIRIAQGAHFFSDILASALTMWLVSLSICWIIFHKSEERCTA